MHNSSTPIDFAIVGGGPAGLMAAEILSTQTGASVHLFDGMPSVGRKFLLAGRGGLNITHSEPFAPDAAQSPFTQRYGQHAATVAPWLAQFSPDTLREWVHALGLSTFVGSSGRVFPTDMKSAPLLRAWLQRLRAAGVVFHARHRWQGWTDDGALSFTAPENPSDAPKLVRARATVLALGGASWQRLGSDGAWLPLLQARGVAVAALQPSNCGFSVRTPRGVGWSDRLRESFAGQPIKPASISVPAHGAHPEFKRQGEFVLTDDGIEGSLVYAASALLRDTLSATGTAQLSLDLLPQHSTEQVLREVVHPRGSKSLSGHLKSRLGLHGIKTALLYEVLTPQELAHAPSLAHAIKALPLQVTAARPIDEAISTAGGVTAGALDANLMLKALPGVFCAGEMLDWEAPTGGYLLSACWASGRAAAQGAAQWLTSCADAPENVTSNPH